MINYKPLWHTLINKNLKKIDLVKNEVIARATLSKLGKNEYVSLEVLENICLFLDCPIEEVVQIEKNPE